jgi:DmsE family decaheme c-type cytochrome
MSLRVKIGGIILLGLLLCLSPGAFGKDRFNLKPGARGKVCLSCHDSFGKKVKEKYIHTPVRKGKCTGCHSPHASDHGKLLSANPAKICASCHTKIVPKDAKSTHRVVEEGKCISCHDPHGGKVKFNLVKGGNELCFTCHKKLGESVKSVKFSHNPVKRSCGICHDPHGSKKADHILKKDVPGLCKRCHKVNSKTFSSRHKNYPVGKADCTSCHNPHGSNVAGLLYDNVHRPVAVGKCKQCHVSPTSQKPFRTKKAGYDLCRGCHFKMFNETFSKNRVHWPLVSEKSCLSCHTPHASSHGSLMKEDMASLCANCHEDSVKRGKEATSKHEPLIDGNCTSCHNPHGADRTFLLADKSVINLCGECHDWNEHTSHPVGKKIVDQRNQNITVSCISCHDAHGSKGKHMFYFLKTNDLCTQCHKQLRR